MTLIEDSRQQKTKHELKHAYWSEHGVQVFRCKLIVGDYALMPSLSKIIDTKADMSEIAQNIGGGKEEHKRFINELKLAQDLGVQLFVLVENTEDYEVIDDCVAWVNPRTEFSPNCIQGPRLAKAMRTIEERYGCVFMFCRPEEAAETIIDLLR